ncbi:KTSC domain-containing protein [Burkholderia pseudomallei]|uniref:KTSC domain-containing protein n=1 Tax=Burkholderia pseudomallei TaxID=28450 RepID=UPI00051035ED|nr:KTSC domain-containing protein [Burkholderia pseudomallei]KGC51001.1 KTSC domain protein [Burkholderia pseudomallei]
MNTELHIDLQKVESSRIHSIGHDAESRTLAIRFLRGDQPGPLYYYSNYPTEEFEKFKSAESIGSFFSKNIKPLDRTYPYRKIDEQTN